MSLKVLSVDDSRAVRIIVKKAFKNYEADIVEACNGEEGFAAAHEHMPDIILLDVTMPVMDGVEMLKKLKADVKVKNIPVIMLTAEAGKEKVMQIAKIGVRDYVVKPFEEKVLIEKVKKIVTLNEKAAAKAAPKSFSDKCDILVFDEKGTGGSQIKEATAGTSCAIKEAKSFEEAQSACEKDSPHIVFVSLSLPDEGCSKFCRWLRSNGSTKDTPVLGLSDSSNDEEKRQAREVGVTTLLSKPIVKAECVECIARSLKLDITGEYFKKEGDAVVVTVSKDLTGYALQQFSERTLSEVSSAKSNGINRAVFDMGSTPKVDLEIVKILVSAHEACAKAAVEAAFVAAETVISECKENFEEAKNWAFFSSLDEAKKQPATA